MTTSWVRAARRTKINSSDPPLTAVCTTYATPPFPPFFHPPIELASFRPRGRLHRDRRIDFSAICFGMLLHLAVAEIHIRLEYVFLAGLDAGSGAGGQAVALRGGGAGHLDANLGVSSLGKARAVSRYGGGIVRGDTNDCGPGSGNPDLP
jgi:hypothetical protein